MADRTLPARRRDLAHEPPVPGWPPRPPDAVLRRSRLETYRLRRLERLQQQQPDLHARIIAAQAWHRRLWDRVLPRDRVVAVTLVVLGLTLFDAVATFLLVGLGLAAEANPLLAALIDDVGLGAAMGVRLAVGGVLTLVLAWLSTWRREARPVLAFVAMVLAAVVGLHVLGAVGVLA